MMETFLIPLAFFFGHMMNAISRSADDLAELSKKNNAKKIWSLEIISHSSNILTLILFISGAWIPIKYEWYWYLIILILTRSFYDYIRNILMNKPIGYRGSSWWDKILIKLKMPESYLFMVRLIALILAFTFAYRFHI